MDWTVILLSVGCIGNSVGVVCLAVTIWMLNRNQRAMWEEILRLKNRHLQSSVNSTDGGVSESGRREKDMEQGAHDGGNRTSMSADFENLSKGI